MRTVLGRPFRPLPPELAALSVSVAAGADVGAGARPAATRDQAGARDGTATGSVRGGGADAPAEDDDGAAAGRAARAYDGSVGPGVGTDAAAGTADGSAGSGGPHSSSSGSRRLASPALALAPSPHSSPDWCDRSVVRRRCCSCCSLLRRRRCRDASSPAHEKGKAEKGGNWV